MTRRQARESTAFGARFVGTGPGSVGRWESQQGLTNWTLCHQGAPTTRSGKGAVMNSLRTNWVRTRGTPLFLDGENKKKRRAKKAKREGTTPIFDDDRSPGGAPPKTPGRPLSSPFRRPTRVPGTKPEPNAAQENAIALVVASRKGTRVLTSPSERP